MSTPKERPIIFSGPMVRALLEGRKTQTRRVVTGLPVYVTTLIGSDNRPTHEFGIHWAHERVINEHVRCPYGQPGDHLWVRETWRAETTGESRNLYYRADEDWHESAGWRSSTSMPRWASRIALEVTGVRVQRLQEISEEDARAEGVQPVPFCKAGRPAGLEHVEAFEELWDSVNGKQHPWYSNPWVWAVSFRVVISPPM